jgi:transcriptional regulator with XRE-family HTH domain
MWGMVSSSFDLVEARRRLGLSQAQLASAWNVIVRTLQNWEAGKGTIQLAKKTGDLRELLSRMDDYVVAPQEKEWLSASLGLSEAEHRSSSLSTAAYETL